MSELIHDDLALFERCLDTSADPLTEAGAARRATMRSLLIGRVVRRRRVRRAVRAGLALALAVGVSLAWLWPARAPDPVAPMQMAHAELGFVRGDVPATLAVQWVTDDDTLLTRWGVPDDATPQVALLDDAELLALLVVTDHPHGFVRIGSSVLLAAELVE